MTKASQSNRRAAAKGSGQGVAGTATGPGSFPHQPVQEGPTA